MKSTAGLLILSVLFTVCCGESRHGDFYKRWLKEAQRQEKLILLDFTAIWCSGCKAYEKYVFQDSLIRERISECFILHEIDHDKPENDFLLKKFKIHGIPHIMIIDHHEQIIGSMIGFDSEYIDDPDLFLSRIQNIVNSQSRIKELESRFGSDSNDVGLIYELLKAYQEAGRFIEVQNLKDRLVQIDPTPERMFEHNFNMAVQILENELNPNPLLSFLQSNPDLNDNHVLIASSQLLNYYQKMDNIQMQDYYYNRLLDFNPDYYKKNYARFLFEHNFKIDTAILLTKECLLNENLKNDHWGQFLKAHSLSYKGKINQAVHEYSEWMENNKQRWIDGETYWPLYFYASFANFHNTDLDRALNYIEFAEAKRNMIMEKLLMAEILYKLGMADKSIEKLKEASKYTNDKKEYDEINGLIEKYKKEQ